MCQENIFLWQTYYLGSSLDDPKISSLDNPKIPSDDFGDAVRIYEVLTQSYHSEEVNIFEILHITVTDARMEKIKTVMRLDQDMQNLIRMIESGWPNEHRCYPR